VFGTKRHCIIATPSHQQALRASGTTYCNGKRKTDDRREKRYSYQSKRDQAEWARHRLGDLCLKQRHQDDETNRDQYGPARYDRQDYAASVLSRSGQSHDMIHRGLTNRLLSVVRPRMADKTSWTKPPSVHHYGDSRGGARRAEAVCGPRGRPPPEGGGTRSSDRGGADAASGRDARPSSAWGQTANPASRSGSGRGRGPKAQAHSRGVQARAAQRARGRRGEDLGDAQPALRTDGTALDVDAGQPQHEGRHRFGRRLGR